MAADEGFSTLLLCVARDCRSICCTRWLVWYARNKEVKIQVISGFAQGNHRVDFLAKLGEASPDR